MQELYLLYSPVRAVNPCVEYILGSASRDWVCDLFYRSLFWDYSFLSWHFSGVGCQTRPIEFRKFLCRAPFWLPTSLSIFIFSRHINLIDLPISSGCRYIDIASLFYFSALAYLSSRILMRLYNWENSSFYLYHFFTWIYWNVPKLVRVKLCLPREMALLREKMKCTLKTSCFNMSPGLSPTETGQVQTRGSSSGPRNPPLHTQILIAFILHGGVFEGFFSFGEFFFF